MSTPVGSGIPARAYFEAMAKALERPLSPDEDAQVQRASNALPEGALLTEGALAGLAPEMRAHLLVRYVQRVEPELLEQPLRVSKNLADAFRSLLSDGELPDTLLELFEGLQLRDPLALESGRYWDSRGAKVVVKQALPESVTLDVEVPGEPLDRLYLEERQVKDQAHWFYRWESGGQALPIEQWSVKTLEGLKQKLTGYLKTKEADPMLAEMFDDDPSDAVIERLAGGVEAVVQRQRQALEEHLREVDKALAAAFGDKRIGAVSQDILNKFAEATVGTRKDDKA